MNQPNQEKVPGINRFFAQGELRLVKQRGKRAAGPDSNLENAQGDNQTEAEARVNEIQGVNV